MTNELLGHWSLVIGIWSLGFGHWDLGNCRDFCELSYQYDNTATKDDFSAADQKLEDLPAFRQIRNDTRSLAHRVRSSPNQQLVWDLAEGRNRNVYAGIAPNDWHFRLYRRDGLCRRPSASQPAETAR